MRGHQHLIQMRMNRRKPEIVFLNDYPCETSWVEYGECPTICTHGDRIQELDLRFLVGLTVSISSTVEMRAKQLFEVVKKAGAAVVAACHVQVDKHQFEQSGWSEFWQKEGVTHG